MITIRGYHGYLKPAQAKKMDAIAMPTKPNVEWEFEGSVGDFAEQWDEKFMVWRHGKTPENEHPTNQTIFITSFGTFGTY